MKQEMSVDLFMQNIITEARDFAILKHAGQKYGDKEYIVHLDEVFKITKEFNLDFKYQIAAYLHDTIEDTNTTKIELNKKFGLWVSNAVDAVSGEGGNRKERKDSMIRKLNAFDEAINLKMADRLANMRAAERDNPKLLEMYISELDDYDELFKKGDSKIYKALMSFKDNSLKLKNKM